ncbi:hypothetical protein [Sphingobacterium suaedae]|uniref:Uncharacterized protein n=1 Tax=Sphingobacterium suaedae TaxID=1686402 RepID=A0ABW5KHE5_9SPHI
MKTKCILFSTLIATIILSVVSCGKDDGPQDGSTNSYPKDVTIEYKFNVASGSPNKVELAYTNESGGTENVKDVTLPYSKKIRRTVNAYDGVSARFSAFGPGGIKAEIYIDNKLIGSKTASSNAATASFNDAVSYIWR